MQVNVPPAPTSGNAQERQRGDASRGSDLQQRAQHDAVRARHGNSPPHDTHGE
jgi:hypothetical protein